MKVKIIMETEHSNEYEVTAERFIDTDSVDGRCVRRELIIDDIDITMNGHYIDFDNLRDDKREMILDALQEAE